MTYSPKQNKYKNNSFNQKAAKIKKKLIKK